MAAKKDPPPARSPLQPAVNHGNVPPVAVHAQCRINHSRAVSMDQEPEIIHITASRSKSSFVVRVRVGDLEKIVGTVKLHHRD